MKRRVACLFAVVAIAAMADVPKTATIIPAPREMRVTGGECCNWTSHTWNRFDMEWKLWPRGFAMAEVLWTYPDPAKRDFKEFEARAAEYRHRLIHSHVNCAPLK